MDGFCLWGDRKVDCENHELSITYEELLRFSVGYVSMWKCQQKSPLQLSEVQLALSMALLDPFSG